MGVVGFAARDGEVKGMINDDSQVSGFSMSTPRCTLRSEIPFMEMGNSGRWKV